jgi:hypothetical protein
LAGGHAGAGGAGGGTDITAGISRVQPIASIARSAVEAVGAGFNASSAVKGATGSADALSIGVKGRGTIHAGRASDVSSSECFSAVDAVGESATGDTVSSSRIGIKERIAVRAADIVGLA